MGSTDDNADQRGRECMSDRDRIGRSVTERQSASRLVEKANLGQPSDEAGEPSEGSERFGGGGQLKVRATSKV